MHLRLRLFDRKVCKLTLRNILTLIGVLLLQILNKNDASQKYVIKIRLKKTPKEVWRNTSGKKLIFDSHHIGPREREKHTLGNDCVCVHMRQWDH